MAVVSQQPQRGGALQSLRGDLVAPPPGRGPLPVPYATAGGGTMEIAQGFQAIVSDMRAASREIRDAVISSSLQMDKVAMFMQEQRRPGAMGSMGVNTRGELVSAFQEAFLTTAAAVVTSAGQMVPGAGGPPGGPPGGPYVPQTGGPFQESPASQGRVPSTSQMGHGVPGTTGRHGAGLEQYQTNRDLFGGAGQGGGPKLDPFGIRAGMGQQGFDVGGIRQKIAGSIQRGLSSAQIGPDLAADASGRMRWAAHTGKGGQFATADEVTSFGRAQKLQSVIGEIGESGFAKGLAGAFPKVGAALGGGAAVAGAVWAGSEIYADQRAQNAEFQRVLGGSNLEAMRERGKQQMFGLQQRFGGMGSAEASKLYAGVVGVNENSLSGGFNRGAALNFGQNNYSRYGMTSDESIKLINMASAHGETSLNGLADALDRVTESARKAGVDADKAREKFVGYYQAAIQGGSGRNASTIASAMATMQSGLGPGFQNMDMSGMLSGPNQMVMQAQTMGLTRPQYMAAISQPGGGAAVQGEAMKRVLQPLAARALGSRALGAIAGQSEEMKKYGERFGTKNLPQARWDEIVRTAEANGADPFITQQVVQQMTGQNMSPEDSLKYLIGNQTGIIDPAAEAKAAQGDSALGTPGKDLTEEIKNNPDKEDILKKRIGGWSKTHQPWEDAVTKRRHADREAYVHRLGAGGRTGKSSPIVEKLLRDHDDDRRFRVESEDGPRVVTLKEAMESYYDQLASGTAEIVAGEGQGDTAATFAGMAENTSAVGDLGIDSARKEGAGQDKKGKDRVAKGQALKDFEKDKEKDSKSGNNNVKVEIVAAPELKGFIEARTVGTASGAASTARTQNTAPPRSTPPATRFQPGDN